MLTLLHIMYSQVGHFLIFSRNTKDRNTVGRSNDQLYPALLLLQQQHVIKIISILTCSFRNTNRFTHLLPDICIWVFSILCRAAKTSFSSLACLVWRGMRARGSVLLCGRSMFAEYEITAGTSHGRHRRLALRHYDNNQPLWPFALVSQFHLPWVNTCLA